MQRTPNNPLRVMHRGALAAFAGLALTAIAPSAWAADEEDSYDQLERAQRSNVTMVQSSASGVESRFANASDAIAFANRDSALSRILELRTYLGQLANSAIDLAPLAGNERATTYATELLAISDALLGVKNLAALLELQTRYRATYSQRLALVAEAEKNIHHSHGTE